MIRNFTNIMIDKSEKLSGTHKSAGIIFLALLTIVFLFNVTGCSQKDVDTEIEVSSVTEQPNEGIKVGDDGVNGAIAPDEIAIVADQNATRNTAMVAMSVDDMGRSDPFLPDHEGASIKPKPNYDFDLMPPPESITLDPTAEAVISTKVSGIMYDKFNPSAILNISGSDYLVRTGDIINNYKVLAIDKSYVTVQNGSNIYKAGVGELFTGEGVNYNTVSNLESKFGGRKNSANK